MQGKKRWPIAVLAVGGSLFLIRSFFGIVEAARSGWAWPEVLGFCPGIGISGLLLGLAYGAYRRYRA
jgi:hypothetical protein